MKEVIVDSDSAARIIRGMLGLRTIERIEHLEKGYSQDQKYVLWRNDAPTYLARFSAMERFEESRRVFDLVKLHYARGVCCPEPLCIGVDHEEPVCCAVYTYIPGDSAEDTLPSMSKNAQYQVGIQAAAELRKVHQMPCPDSSFNWYEHRKAKFFRQWDLMKRMGLGFPGQEVVLSYIESNLELMRGVPCRFQHDDYHPGNLILQNGELAGVIDFKCDWGDPIHDFYKLPQLTCYMSMPFAVGQVVGYHEGVIPGSFWRLYNLYVAMNAGSSLTWGKRQSPRRFEMFRSRVDETLSTHDFVSGGPPSWFSDFKL